MSAGAVRRGEVITFYSFKGGVGRSMALANIAALEAQRGKRVLALDFDFEAPGLHRYFLKPERHEPASAQSGVLNLFAALRERLRSTFPAGWGLQDADASSRLRALIAEQVDSDKYLYKVQLNDPNSRKPRTVSVDFIAAARFDGTYSDLVRTFDWQGFYDEYAELFPALVDELGSRYDVVLVDSRTGVTDIGSICTMALPDKLVLVFSPNEQSLAGALDAGWQAVQGRKETGVQRALGIFPLVSRVEESEEKQKREWINRARESFEKLTGLAYGVAECDLRAYFDAVRIPHRGYYAYGERIAVEEQPVRESGSLAQVYDQLADGLECADVIGAQRALAPGRGLPGAQDHASRDLIIKLFEAGKLSQRPSEAARAYDDLIPRLTALQAQGAPNSDMLLAEALDGKARALDDLYRFDEAVNVYEEIVRRFGDATDALRREESDRAIHNLGNALENLGRHEDALNTYERIITGLEGRSDAYAAEALARALFAKGTILRDQNKDAEAIAAYDKLLNQFRDSSSPVVRTQALKAMVNKAASLAKLGDDETVMAIREEIIRRYRESPEAEHREAVAVVWTGKLAVVAQREDGSKVVTECDEMLRWASDARDPQILLNWARVATIKSGLLDALNRRDDAIATIDMMMTRIGNVREPILAEPIAGALLLKSLYLTDMGRSDEARAARADLVRRFRHEPDGFAQNAVANALIMDVRELEASGHPEGALAALSDALTRLPTSKDQNLRKNFYGLLVAKGLLLARLARCSEAVASADDAYDRLTAAHDADARALVPHALAVTGFTRICLAKQTWLGGDEVGARALLEGAASRLQMALDRAPTEPSVMGDAAYAAFLLGHQDKARDLLTRAIALGGSKVREAEFKDADICTLPQDDAFRELVRSIPDAPPA